jgi:hypothetical protein
MMHLHVYILRNAACLNFLDFIGETHNLMYRKEAAVGSNESGPCLSRKTEEGKLGPCTRNRSLEFGLI